jgi:long-chain fatty acid transport protein
MPSLPARPTHWRLLASAAWLACAAGQAHGAAYQLGTGDPDWLANAFAGTAAKAYDAGSAWNNPAGMTLIQGNEIDSGLNYFDPGIRFSGEDVVNGVAVRGYQGGDAAPSAVTAGSETVISLSRDLKLGVAVEAPFGLRTSYPSSFVGRYQSLVSAIEDLQFAPSLAYQVTPQLSVGGGPAVSYFRARLSQAIDTTIYDRTAGDPTLDIRGDDIKVGYNIGALYQFTPSLRLGVDYHSRIGQNVVGKQQATVPTSLTTQVPFVAAVVDALNQDVSTQIALPDYLTISGYYDVTQEWAVMATAQWTDWSLIKTLTINTPTSEEATPINYRNTWLGSVGANYRPAWFPKLMLQTGVLYDEGAVTNVTRGPRVPDEDRIGISGGFTYQITPKLAFRASYLHEFATGGNNIDYSDNFPGAGSLIGTYADNADVVSAGIKMNF